MILGFLHRIEALIRIGGLVRTGSVELGLIPAPGAGGYSHNFWIGVCRQGS